MSWMRQKCSIAPDAIVAKRGAISGEPCGGGGEQPARREYLGEPAARPRGTDTTVLLLIVSPLSFAAMSRKSARRILPNTSPSPCGVSKRCGCLKARWQRRPDAHAMDNRPLVRNYDHNTARDHRH